MKTLIGIGLSSILLTGCVMDGNQQPDDSAGYEHHDSAIDTLDKTKSSERSH